MAKLPEPLKQVLALLLVASLGLGLGYLIARESRPAPIIIYQSGAGLTE